MPVHRPPCHFLPWGLSLQTPGLGFLHNNALVQVSPWAPRPHPSCINLCHLHSPSFTREETGAQRGEVTFQTKCRGQPTNTCGPLIKVVTTVSSSFKGPRQNLLRQRRRWTMSFHPGQAQIYKLQVFKGPHHKGNTDKSLTHVHPWLIHVNVWRKPLQYCKVISLQLK